MYWKLIHCAVVLIHYFSAMNYILALDQGTTSSRAILFDESQQPAFVAQQEFRQFYPQPGWVEHDAIEIWKSQLAVAEEVIQKAGITSESIKAIGITNQRETVVVWDAETGRPIHRAIVWQDRRTAERCDQMKVDGMEPYIRKATGLVCDAYFSGTKISRILDDVPGARERAAKGELRCGTIDSWLIWKLTNGAHHVTDASNASRTMLFNISEGKWDQKLLEYLDVPNSLLPEVVSSSGLVGRVSIDSPLKGIPICGIAGDQQAALYGQQCLVPGEVKNTYGTGCFMLMNTGDKQISSQNGLLTTVAWQIDDRITYALEGSVFVAGAAIQWLRDGLKIIDESPDSEWLASKIESSEGVYVVPAFVGLGAPYWDMYAKGAIYGLTRGTTKAHIARATLESLAYQTRDVLDAMQQDSGLNLSVLKADGGASANELLMQFQADILNTNVARPEVLETTALGAASLAARAVNAWTNQSTTSDMQIFNPEMDDDKRQELYSGWKDAIRRTMSS